MIKIPEALQKKYNLLLMNSDIALDQYSHCKKWLRYYLDFCKKYSHMIYTHTVKSRTIKESKSPLDF